MTMRKLLQLLEANPDCFIYYKGKGKFIIFTERPTSQKEEYLSSITLYEGDDSLLSRGHVPTLVVALATMIGVDVGSK